jgi:hypothetical protein
MKLDTIDMIVHMIDVIDVIVHMIDVIDVIVHMIDVIDVIVHMIDVIDVIVYMIDRIDRIDLSHNIRHHPHHRYKTHRKDRETPIQPTICHVSIKPTLTLTPLRQQRARRPCPLPPPPTRQCCGCRRCPPPPSWWATNQARWCCGIWRNKHGWRICP